jgi:hypothetical protein
MARSPLLFATDNETDPTGFHLTQANRVSKRPINGASGRWCLRIFDCDWATVVLAVPIKKELLR